MSSVPQGDYRSIGGMEGQTVSGRKFFVVLAGNTNDTHTSFVSRIKTKGYEEVTSQESYDFILLFCPVVSRVGTDIGEALQNVTSDKEILLVVMHHTFNPDTALAESKRQVEDPRVRLTVDCVFFESELLNCNRNDIAWDQICRSLEISPSQTLSPKGCVPWLKNHKLIVGVTVVSLVVVIILASVLTNRQ